MSASVFTDVLGTPPGSPRAGRAPSAFAALLWRDTFVTGKELVSFLAQVLIQPILLLFVFGKVLADLGYTQGGYATVLFPGIVALTAFLTALQNTSFPLVIDFSYTKEIEDRLLAPLPIGLVAVEKVVFATVRALLAASLMFPLGWWILGPLGLRWSDAPVVFAILVLGALSGSAVGLVLGTLVKPQKMNIVFSLALAPLMFTGAIQFPWPSLDGLRWFQVVCAINPLTYLSEALRGVMLDDVPHLSLLVCVPLLVVSVVVFGAIGARGFRMRALD